MHDDKALHARARSLYKRRRVPTRVKLRAIKTYLAGASLRGTAWALRGLYPFSHEAVRQWVQRIGHLFRATPEKRELVVVDETSVFLADGQERFVWAALDPATREVILTWVTQGRGGMEARLFFKNVLRRCKNKPHVQVDAGVWYPWALDSLNLEWNVQCGGHRNLVESYFGSLKHRLDQMKRRPGTWHTEDTLPNLVKMHAWRWNRTRSTA